MHINILMGGISQTSMNLKNKQYIKMLASAEKPRVCPGNPLIPSLPHILLYLLVSFTFSYSRYYMLHLFIFLLFHPFSFYQNSPTPFPGRMS